MGLGGVAIAALPSMIHPKLSFSDSLGGVFPTLGLLKAGSTTAIKNNAFVRFHQEDTLKRIFERLENARIHINRARMDFVSCDYAIRILYENESF